MGNSMEEKHFVEISFSIESCNSHNDLGICTRKSFKTHLSEDQVIGFYMLSLKGKEFFAQEFKKFLLMHGRSQ